MFQRCKTVCCRGIDDTYIACNYEQTQAAMPQWLRDWSQGSQSNLSYRVVAKACSSELLSSAATLSQRPYQVDNMLTTCSCLVPKGGMRHAAWLFRL